MTNTPTPDRGDELRAPDVPNDNWAHPDRIKWLKENTTTLHSFGGHVVHDLLALLDEQRAVIERLNHTKDGKPILPGDRVYRYSHLTNRVEEYVYRAGHRAHKENPHSTGPHVWKAYSTREAALAASEGSDE